MANKNNFSTIIDGVNALEELHKTCQLVELGLHIPVLNESRYLARALAALLDHPDNAGARSDAERAVNCAINDAIDLLVSHIKTTTKKMEKIYGEDFFKHPETLRFDKYSSMIDALDWIEPKIIHSRGHRDARRDLYLEVANSSHIKALKDFAISLPSIEIGALRENKLHPEKHQNHGSTIWLTQFLADGIKNNTLDFALQPKYLLEPQNEKKLIGAELLLRAPISAGHALPIPRLIEIAEQSGLIIPLGNWIIQKGCECLREMAWLPELSVNVSPVQLHDLEFGTFVKEAVKHIGRQEKCLELEITESTVIRDADIARRHFESLRDHVNFAIDDFGTGETRFDYLSRFNFSTIKIDKSLIDSALLDEKFFKLIQSVSSVGKIFSLQVIAEGIEQESTARTLLEQCGVNRFQGYYFGKPVTKADFEKFHCLPGLQS